MSFLAIVLSPPFFNSVCVQAFIIWITVVEVMVYPFELEPVLYSGKRLYALQQACSMHGCLLLSKSLF